MGIGMMGNLVMERLKGACIHIHVCDNNCESSMLNYYGPNQISCMHNNLTSLDSAHCILRPLIHCACTHVILLFTLLEMCSKCTLHP